MTKKKQNAATYNPAYNIAAAAHQLEFIHSHLLCAEQIVMDRIPKHREYVLADQIKLAILCAEELLPKKRKK